MKPSRRVLAREIALMQGATDDPAFALEVIGAFTRVDTSSPPFRLPDDIVLALPCPPSANNLFFNRRGGKGRSRSPEYLNWLELAGWHLKQHRQSPINGPVCVSIVVQENVRRDLDGYPKAVLDLLVAHRLIPDDRCKYVREIRIAWGKIEGCRVTVTSTGEHNASERA